MNDVFVGNQVVLSYNIPSVFTPLAISLKSRKIISLEGNSHLRFIRWKRTRVFNISYYIVLGTKANDLKCSTHFASSWQIHRSWQSLSVDKNTRPFDAVLSSSVNPNALVINHFYCQIHFPYYITFFQNS